MSRPCSVGLARDVDEVVDMVGLLHGRLSDAASWTKNLEEDTQASRQKVASLIAQVNIDVVLTYYPKQQIVPLLKAVAGEHTNLSE